MHNTDCNAREANGHIDDLKDTCRGRWPEIFRRLAPELSPALDSTAQKINCPLPGHDDSAPSFRIDKPDDGRAICSCGSYDGWQLLGQIRGWSFSEAVQEVAEVVGFPSQRRNGSSSSLAVPVASDVDFIEAMAREKRCPARSLIAYGATALQRGCVGFPLFDATGKQCSGFYVYPLSKSELSRKGRNQTGKRTGMFLPLADGEMPRLPRLPKAGETVILCEGVKDAAMLHALGYFTIGLPGKSLKKEWLPLFKGVHVVLCLDNDAAGIAETPKLAKKLAPIAASVRVVTLPASGDVRDNIATAGEQAVRDAIDAAEASRHKANASYVSAPGLPDIAGTRGQTDAANATRFVDEFHRELIHVPPWRKWLSWDGSRWAEDAGVGVMQRAKRYAEDLWNHLPRIAKHLDEGDLAKVVTFIKGTNQTQKIHSFLTLASVDERVVCPVDELNSDPTLLNVANGTIDLTTGKLRPHNPADRITQLANVVYDPDAKCPEWENTLDLIFNFDPELTRYVQRLLGYSISGDTGEHVLPIAWGKGNNGKSTVWNVVADLLGDYASLANEDLLMGEKNSHPTDKCGLYQKRFVAISEPEKNSKLKESRVKELTGDRFITARRMKEDFWTFQRTHTFWLSTNYLPRIDGTDEGIWRRVKLIPFAVDLREKVEVKTDFDTWLVKNEGPGILAWLVRGYLGYRNNGFAEPLAVTNATSVYRGDSDPLGDFLDDYCIIESDAEETSKELFRVYKDLHGGKWTQTGFGKAMAERFKKDRPDAGNNRKKTVYLGVRLRCADDNQDDNQEGQSDDF